MASANRSQVPCFTEIISSPAQLSLPPTRSALHFYPIWEAASLDEWLYNGGPYQLIVFHFLIGCFCYLGRQWELSYRLGMRPWICVAYSAPFGLSSRSILDLPHRTRFLLRRYAFGYLGYLQLHDCVPSRT